MLHNSYNYFSVLLRYFGNCKHGDLGKMTDKEKAQSHIMRMDIIVYAAEIKWGLPMALVDLVGGEIAEKFRRQWQNLNAAINECRHADVCVLADGVCRGVYALEKIAFEAGQIPLAMSPIGVPLTMPDVQKNGTGVDVKFMTSEFFANGGDSLADMI